MLFKIRREALSESDREIIRRALPPYDYIILETDTPFIQIGRPGFVGAVAEAYIDAYGDPIFRPFGNEADAFALMMHRLFGKNFVPLYDDDEVIEEMPTSDHVDPDNYADLANAVGGQTPVTLTILPSWPL